jgi:hypothetical protein
MQSHAVFVWDKYVKPSTFSKLYIVAHSAGGSCLSSIQTQFSMKTNIYMLLFIEDDFYDRTQKIALTDSWVIGKE